MQQSGEIGIMPLIPQEGRENDIPETPKGPMHMSPAQAMQSLMQQPLKKLVKDAMKGKPINKKIHRHNQDIGQSYMDIRSTSLLSPTKVSNALKKAKTPTKESRLVPESPAFNCNDLEDLDFGAMSSDV